MYDSLNFVIIDAELTNVVKTFYQDNLSCLSSPNQLLAFLDRDYEDKENEGGNLYSVMKFNEDTLSFEKYHCSIYGNLKFTNTYNKMRCYHFTDGRKHTMGGRCIVGNRKISIVVDFDVFENVDPGNLVKKRRMLYAPTLNYQKYQSLFKLYDSFDFPFENDIVVYSYANKDYDKVVLIYDLRLQSIFPVRVLINMRYSEYDFNMFGKFESEVKGAKNYQI